MPDFKKDKMAILVAAGILPTDAVYILEDALAAGQELPTPDEVIAHAEVTEADILNNKVWWMHITMKIPKWRRYARLLFGG